MNKEIILFDSKDGRKITANYSKGLIEIIDDGREVTHVIQLYEREIIEIYEKLCKG